MSDRLINMREKFSKSRLLRKTPRRSRRRSRLASHIEFDGPDAEFVAVGHVCPQVRNLEIGILDGGGNAGESENGCNLHGELCRLD